MNKENEFYYDSDEDFYEDFDDDESCDPEEYYLSEAKIDNLIHTIRMYGSKYKYLEIEKLILESDEESVLQWSQIFELIRDPNGSKRLTFNRIEYRSKPLKIQPSSQESLKHFLLKPLFNNGK